MGKTVFGKVMWVGRATVFVVGLAVILALVFGVAVTALAGTGVGAPFNLGKINSVNAISTLSGSVGNGPMLRLDNNSATGSAAALNLQVEPDKQPMYVNSQTKVGNLNSDLLDGQDASSFLGADAKAADANLLDGKDSEQFFPKATYAKNANSTGSDFGNGRRFLAVYCDSGDKLLSGGHYELDAGTSLYASTPDWFHQGWQVEWINDGTADSIQVTAYCADFGTPHSP